MAKANTAAKYKRPHKLKYGKWGIIFILPFFITYAVFQLYPLIMTFYKSFFEEYMDMLDMVGPNFVGFENYQTIFADGTIQKFLGNTMIIWIVGFIPQIFLSILFAAWFTDLRLKLKGTGIYKVILYLPNILMASSVAVLFYTLFGNQGPVNDALAFLTGKPQGTTVFAFFDSVAGTRGIAAFINYLMWTGNTTILLMAGIMGVDTALYEAASIDGANSRQLFWKITIPSLKPILLYVLITSLIGGIQLFDVPQLLTMGKGSPNQTTTTVMMYLNDNISVSKNYGKAGAVSVILFILAAILSFLIFKTMQEPSDKPKKRKMKKIAASTEKIAASTENVQKGVQ
ncbi:MAG: sugar ABC transporter permease [Lachnospiraceae bacterium]|nr:sugar ABC transporter permease [Lachnospiraceae bacterium]